MATLAASKVGGGMVPSLGVLVCSLWDSLNLDNVPKAPIHCLGWASRRCSNSTHLHRDRETPHSSCGHQLLEGGFLFELMDSLRAPNIGGHRNLSCRKAMLLFGSHQAPRCRRIAAETG
ncbi:hypothetical protein T484DRAFT_1985542 [Baffinella frigidus]|nr:hypothetical protein T484DRAFT_1985542 [Cryptophyta sp. CCMP2293]